MEYLQNIAALLVMIGVMVLVHEAGHYLAARYFDVQVDAFSIGFGPRLFGFRRGETDFRISAIPLGGYVSMAGEQIGEAPSDDPRALPNKPRWQQLIVMAAGVVMNAILAVLLLTGLYTVKYQRPVHNGPEGLLDVIAAKSAAAKAGFQPGDRIISIDGSRNPGYEEIEMKVLTNPGHPMEVEYERKGVVAKTTLTPETDPKYGFGIAGWSAQAEFRMTKFEAQSNGLKAGLELDDVLVAANGRPVRSIALLREVTNAAGGAPVEITYLRDGKEGKAMVTPFQGEIEGKKMWRLGIGMSERVETVQLSLIEAFRESVNDNAKNAGMIYRVMRSILVARMSPKTLEGPISIARAAGEAARHGMDWYVGLMASVSLNLAIFNLLPIPVLDGGRILLLLIEMIRRRDLKLETKMVVMNAGLAVLMVLVVFVLFNDIRKTIGG